VAASLKVRLKWIEAEEMANGKLDAELSRVDGILVPAGFGVRGVAGMIEAIRYARQKNVPFFGICLGLQCAVIECARNLAGLSDADSTEFNEATPYKVIYKLRDLLGVDDLGGTMRLGRVHREPGSREPRATGVRRGRGDRSASPPVRGQPEFLPKLTAAGLSVSGFPPTDGSSRSSSTRSTRGSWRASSTRSTSRARSRPTRSSGTSSPRPIATSRRAATPSPSRTKMPSPRIRIADGVVAGSSAPLV
jgi:hypothetical protein